jgi:hypothetical protein
LRDALLASTISTAVETTRVGAMWECTFRRLRRSSFFAGELAQEIFEKSKWTGFSLWQLLLYESG